MKIEPLKKLVIVKNYHITDDIIQFNLSDLTTFLSEKGFNLSHQIECPYISIFEKKESQYNEKFTHVHFGLNNLVERVAFYVSEIK